LFFPLWGVANIIVQCNKNDHRPVGNLSTVAAMAGMLAGTAPPVTVINKSDCRAAIGGAKSTGGVISTKPEFVCDYWRCDFVNFP
tara:strand:- start:6110 stop:6364 length:255 start_codon:yes stop_codon:yes gene_type:complete